ncbi:MAG: M28 family peptidase [Bacteroidia bacterium]|nr:M28 family peptidase [Bacteroidia bacterium]
MRSALNHPALTIIITVFLLSGCSSQHSPYPSLDKQREALKNKPFVTPTRLLDSAQIIDDLKFLSSDSCEGRLTGSVGHERAVERILQRMREAGLDSFNSSLQQIFTSRKIINHVNTGDNIIGWLKGTSYSKEFVVVSAHYDHIGMSKTGEIYHGASDNASGTACILAMAKYFKLHPLPYSLIFTAFDREETGLEGSDYFVQHLSTLPGTGNIMFNLNIDMIARNDSNEIFACGISQYPSFKDVIAQTQKKINAKLLMGHDDTLIDKGRDFWVKLSDHYSFYKKGIPFIYLGVADHPDYHKPSDTWDKINFSRYIENCNLSAIMLQVLKL